MNYNRAELPRGPDGQPNLGAGIKDERPLAVSAIVADVVLPTGATQVSVRFLSPEQEGEQTLKATVKDGRVRFTLPDFLVYGVARITFQEAKSSKKP